MLVRRAIATGIFGEIPLNRQIANLFRSGEQGAWYDPSDWSTLFQDSAGTTPVTAVGQPVGLMLDKRLGLARGAELVANGGFDSAANWSLPANASISGGKLVFTGSTAEFVTQSLSSHFIAGKWYEVTVDIVVTAGSNIRLPYDGGVVNIKTASPSGQYRYAFMSTGSPSLYIGYATGFTGTMDNISIRELLGNHARQPTAINRPILQQDASGRYYLAFNGTNSWMSTSAIDFTGADKMTVCAGVRTLGVTAGTLLINNGATPSPGVDGIFSLDAPGFTNNAYVATISKAIGNGDAMTASFVAPSVDVLSARYDGNAASPSGVVTLRRNGVMSSANSSSTVNSQYFLNAPIYIGCRGGGVSFFNGSVYGLLLRGAASTDAQISAPEKFLNQKTGAY